MQPPARIIAERVTAVREARSHIRSLDRLRDAGWTDHGIRTHVTAGLLLRVAPGRFVPAEEYNAATPEQRHLFAVIAHADRRCGGTGVYALVSAAAVWGLPFFRIVPTQVHMAGCKDDGRTHARARPEQALVRARVARHDSPVAESDRIEIAGIPITSLERTAFDLARTTSRPAALTFADAALALVARAARSRAYDADASGAWLDSIARRICDNPGLRGIAQARVVLPLADGRAERPIESASRMHLHDLGFARPQLQVRVPGPHGNAYYVDFGLEDIAAWGEADGRIKYTSKKMAAGRTLEQILLEEKTRNDWIHGSTGRRVLHWMWEHIATTTTFARHLAKMRVRSPHRHRPSWT